MIATSEGKASAVQDMIEGPMSAFCLASALQHHERVSVVIDETTASALKLKGYYQFVREQLFFLDGILGRTDLTEHQDSAIRASEIVLAPDKSFRSGEMIRL